MKKVLFHSLTIPPDNVSTGMLVAEIADGFKGLGVDVEILASSPQYNVEKSLNSSKTKFGLRVTNSPTSFRAQAAIFIASAISNPPEIIKFITNRENWVACFLRPRLILFSQICLCYLDITPLAAL